MKHLSPSYEAIKPSISSSFRFLKFLKNTNVKSSFWHYHPEIELIFVGGGSGKRQIGSSISYYTEGDLILIGSNLPHCGLTDETTNDDYEIVIQFLPEFLGENFWDHIEMSKIKTLLATASAGIVFGEETKKQIRNTVEGMADASPLHRLTTLLEVLEVLATTDDFKLLNGGKYQFHTQVEDNDRINLIFNYVKDHFRDQINVEDVAELTHLTVPSFCRYFKKVTNKTFTHFVNEYRITHSLKLLSEQPLSITEICYESGFNNFSYFNRTFKSIVGKSPLEYRKEFRNIVD